MVLGKPDEKVQLERKEEIKEEKQIAIEQKKEDKLTPKLIDETPLIETPLIETPMPTMSDMIIQEEKSPVIHWDLSDEETLVNKNIVEAVSTNTVDKMWITEKKEELHSSPVFPSASPANKKEEKNFTENSAVPLTAASGGYLARPSNIYAESKAEVSTSMTSAEEPVSSYHAGEEVEELLDLQMQIVERDDIPAADVPLAHQAQTPLSG